MQLAKGLALVTGSSSGIGRAIAVRLATDGYFVLAHFNSDEAGARKTLNDITGAGGQGQVIQFNVADHVTFESKLDSFLSENPELKLEVLVNNAGIHKDTLTGLMSDEEFDSVIKTNQYGPFYLMRWSIRKMVRQRRGTIVNISSLAGQTGNTGQINYAASKAALIAMTKSLAMEVGSRGIRVNAVAPGLVLTDMISEIPELDKMKDRIPLRRFGTCEEVAGTVSFLCSTDSGYITGTTISVNGGLYPT